MAEIRDQIREYVKELLREQGYGDKLTDETLLVSSGLLDSFAVIRLVVFMEENFGINFADQYFDHSRFDTIAMMVGMVDELAPTDR